MQLVARFPVEADISPFQAQVDEAVQNALVKLGILRETENGKFEVTIGNFKQDSKQAREQEKAKNDAQITDFEEKSSAAAGKAKLAGKLVTRMIISESMQTFNMIAQAAGWTKNAQFQLMSGMIQGVIGMIQTMTLSASSAIATYGPVAGAIIAGVNITQAGVAFGLQTSLQAQQAAMQANNDYIGNIMSGFS